MTKREEDQVIGRVCPFERANRRNRDWPSDQRMKEWPKRDVCRRFDLSLAAHELRVCLWSVLTRSDTIVDRLYIDDRWNRWQDSSNRVRVLILANLTWLQTNERVHDDDSCERTWQWLVRLFRVIHRTNHRIKMDSEDDEATQFYRFILDWSTNYDVWFKRRVSVKRWNYDDFKRRVNKMKKSLLFCEKKEEEEWIMKQDC